MDCRVLDKLIDTNFLVVALAPGIIIIDESATPLSMLSLLKLKAKPDVLLAVGTLTTLLLLTTGGRVVAKRKGEDPFDDAGVGLFDFDTEGLLCPTLLVAVPRSLGEEECKGGVK